jgi:hypothetical protein
LIPTKVPSGSSSAQRTAGESDVKKQIPISQFIAEVRRDLAEARPTRGLVVDTASSINDGSLLSSMRTVMWMIQTDAT